MEGFDLNKIPYKEGYYLYRGRKWKVNKPVRSNRKGKKLMVLATKTVRGIKRAKVIHFGAQGYGHNYSNEAKKNYLRRSARITTKSGKLTKNDPWSANYWARKVLWPANKPANGSKAKSSVSRTWKKAA